MGVHSGSEKDCRSFSVTLINQQAWLWPLARQAERQRNLQLPADATVGQARHCFGLPLPEEAVAMGKKRGDETALWQISQQCKVQIAFQKGESKGPLVEPSSWHVTNLAYRMWRTWRGALDQYQEED